MNDNLIGDAAVETFEKLAEAVDQGNWDIEDVFQWAYDTTNLDDEDIEKIASAGDYAVDIQVGGELVAHNLMASHAELLAEFGNDYIEYDDGPLALFQKTAGRIRDIASRVSGAAGRGAGAVGRGARKVTGRQTVGDRLHPTQQKIRDLAAKASMSAQSTFGSGAENQKRNIALAAAGLGLGGLGAYGAHSAMSDKEEKKASMLEEDAFALQSVNYLDAIGFFDE